MEKVINFIKENWQYLSFAVNAIAVLILCIIKKHPKVYGWYLDMIDLVNQAENTFVGPGRGDEKLDYVVNRFIAKHDLTKDKFNITMVKNMAEKVLSTPSKKGEKHEKKNV